MALKATDEPRLMSESRTVTRKVIMTELRGMFQPGLTNETKSENGRPLSRAKDHVWRDTVATVLISAEVMLIIRMAVKTDAPALLLVTL